MFNIQYSTVQYITVQYSTVQYSTGVQVQGRGPGLAPALQTGVHHQD